MEATSGLQGGGVWTYILFNAGAGFILGFAVGYALKKLLKLVLLFLGLVTLLLLALEYYGIIQVNYGKFVELVQAALNATRGATSGIISHALASLPFAGSFAVGLAVGFKAG